jgi:hypothetical protein
MINPTVAAGRSVTDAVSCAGCLLPCLGPPEMRHSNSIDLMILYRPTVVIATRTEICYPLAYDSLSSGEKWSPG